MSEIKIKCPTCGKVLRLNETPNINAASFTCPICGERHLVGDCQRYYPAPQVMGPSEDTRYGTTPSPQTGSEETRTATAPQGKPGLLEDAGGMSYSLSLGINTIGRKASSSTATVQIATTDRTMSRNHAIIEVRDAGGQLIPLFRNAANKNPSRLNGVLVAQGDQLILNNGDRIQLGNTILTFKK